MKRKIYDTLGAECVLIYTIFLSMAVAITIIILSLKADAETLRPEVPQYVNECGEPVYRRVKVTGYSPTVGQTDSTPTITATNKRVRLGIVAVSRDLEGDFPMNSSMEFWIDGKKYLVVVEDKMGKLKKEQIDLFFWKAKDAKEFGVHRNIIIWRQE